MAQLPTKKTKTILNEQAKQPMKHLIHLAAIYIDEIDGLTKIKTWDVDYEVYPNDTCNLHFTLKGDDLNGKVYQA